MDGRTCAALLLTASIAACHRDDSETGADTCCAVARVDLAGVAVDPWGFGPIAGATAVLEVGGEFLTTTTAADGTFSFADLPETTPVSVTVVAADRTAVTLQGVVPGETTSPLAFRLPLRSVDHYDWTEVEVSTVVQGNRPGTEVCFFWSGPTGEHCASSPGDDDLAVSFHAEILAGAAASGVTILVRDPSDYEILTGLAAPLPLPAQVRLPDDAVRTLTVRTDQPELADEPLDSVDPYATWRAATTYVGDFTAPWGTLAVTGIATAAEPVGATIEVAVPRVPVLSHDNRVQVALARTYAAGHLAWADLLIPAGDDTLDVDLLDGPDAEDQVFAPGTAMSWDAVDGALDYQVRIREDGEVAWEIGSREPAVSFPPLPDGFDTAAIFATGTWEARSRDTVESDWTATALDAGAPGRVTTTAGGVATW